MTVTAFDEVENTVTVQYNDGHQEEFDLRDFQHLDYAIVSTTYSSQGKLELVATKVAF